MQISRSLSLATLIAATALGPAAAGAQATPSGLGLTATTLQPADRMGGSSLTGLGGTALVGLSPRASFEAGFLFYRNGQIETPGSLRLYNMVLPSAALRLSLLGEKTDFALLLGGGAFRYALAAEEGSGSAAETRVLPALSAGASLRVHLAGPFALDLTARDWITRVREGEFTATPGTKRALGHSPELRLSLVGLLRRREPTTAQIEDLPITYADGFRPVDASSVRKDPNATSGGRDHLHTDGGTAIGLKVVDQTELTGEKAPTGVSVLVPTGPVASYEEHKLGAIYFASGSYEVGTSYRTLLKDIARFLQQNPTAQLELRGFTDPKGAARPNLSLAEQRGTAIQELLARLYNIAPGRVSVTALGIDYKTREDAVARRVELVVRLPR